MSCLRSDPFHSQFESNMKSWESAVRPDPFYFQLASYKSQYQFKSAMSDLIPSSLNFIPIGKQLESTIQTKSLTFSLGTHLEFA